jgi:hypothetical protein
VSTQLPRLEHLGSLSAVVMDNKYGGAEKVLNYIILELTPSFAPLYPIHGIFSTDIIFSLTCMCTHF